MNINIKLKPFSVPNLVLEDAPPSKSYVTDINSYAINLVDADDLSRMCDEYRKNVFQKAGKTDPRLQKR